MNLNAIMPKQQLKVKIHERDVTADVCEDAVTSSENILDNAHAKRFPKSGKSLEI